MPHLDNHYSEPSMGLNQGTDKPTVCLDLALVTKDQALESDLPYKYYSSTSVDKHVRSPVGSVISLGEGSCWEDNKESIKDHLGVMEHGDIALLNKKALKRHRQKERRKERKKALSKQDGQVPVIYESWRSLYDTQDLKLDVETSPPCKKTKTVVCLERKRFQVIIGFEKENITPEEADTLRAELGKRIREHNGTEPLQFLKSGVIGSGQFLVTSANTYSMEWLLAQDLPLVGGRKLKVSRAEDLVTPIKVGVYVPRSDQSAQDILHTLNGQNQKLGVNRWRLLGLRKDKNGGELLVVGMNEEQMEVLADVKWKLFFELTTVQARRLGQGRPRGDA